MYIFGLLQSLGCSCFSVVVEDVVDDNVGSSDDDDFLARFCCMAFKRDKRVWPCVSRVSSSLTNASTSASVTCSVSGADENDAEATLEVRDGCDGNKKVGGVGGGKNIDGVTTVLPALPSARLA